MSSGKWHPFCLILNVLISTPKIVIMQTWGATSDDKIDSMTTLFFPSVHKMNHNN